MTKKIAPLSIDLHVKCIAALPGEYLRSGETYHVTQEEKGGDVSFRNTEKQCGTFMRQWSYQRGINNGYLVIL